MAGPISSTPGARPVVAPRPGQLQETGRPADRPGKGPLGQDEVRTSGQGGPAAPMPDMRAEVGDVSWDDFLGAADAATGPKTAAEARRAAEEVWFANRPEESESYLRAERDAFDVNSPRVDPFGTPIPPDEEGDRMALGQMEANRALEKAALQELPAGARQQYEDVARRLEQDPQAGLALQILLLEGKLTHGPRAEDGDDLLTSLHELATHPAAEGIDREALVGDVVQELATPSAIAQKNRGTCTATTLQIKLALERPAEYARLVAGLASPTGEVQMANGDTLRREPGTGTGAQLQAQYQGKPVMIHDLRSVSSQLWQPALMQYGYGPDHDYDNRTDTVSGGAAPGVSMVNRMASGLSGQEATFVRSWREEGGQQVDNRDAVLAALRREVAQRPVAAGIVWGEQDRPGGHEILVTRMDAERVYFDNPHGIEESMALAEFKDRLQGGFVTLADFSGAR